MKLFLSPHNDDAALFGAFTIIREQPRVVTVYDSQRQWNRGYGITAEQRRAEDVAAMLALSNGRRISVDFLHLGDADEHAPLLSVLTKLADTQDFEHVYAPAPEDDGHPQHNLVGNMASVVWPGKVTLYMTYTPRGKSISPNPVPFLPAWLPKKWNALACYESQINLDNTRPHFIRDQTEYYA